MNALTERQRNLLDVISKSMSTRGYPPSLTELGNAVGLASDEAVIRQLRLIQFKGWLKPVPGTRAVQIVENPQEAGNG